MPALKRVRTQAKAVACQSSLHQWAIIFEMYAGQNDGNFWTGDFVRDGWEQYCWTEPLRSNYGVGSLQMERFCLNRHNGYVNGVFLDLSVRRIGLKKLWTFKWHRNFDINGIWTKAGSGGPDDWPEWMRNFRD